MGFDQGEIAACVARKGLLSIELDLGIGPCHCAACEKNPQDALSLEEIRSLLDRAREEGARKCILVDCEPRSHPNLREIIDSAREFGMRVEVFASRGTIDAPMARFLRQREAGVVVKKDSGEAVTNLKEAGYCRDSASVLAAAIEVSEQNISQVPAIWRRLRMEGIEPRVQIITPREGDKNPAHILHPNRAKELFEELGRIDREEFKREWELPAALTGRSCKRHLFACHVTPCGTIFACVGVTIPLGNVRLEPLREILELSEVLENLRAFDQKVKEPCRTCSKTTDCYGCRGAAYQLTGDYLTGDQMCWKAEGVTVESLPVGVAGLVPHGKTMRMVDQLVQIGERESWMTFAVTKECLLVDRSGRLDELAFVEMIAQSFAVTHGYHLSPQERKTHRGLLLGVKDLNVSGEARVGDILTVHLKKVTRFGAFGVVEGAIYRHDGKLVATGQIKIWRRSDAELEVMAI
jgi:radical SAM protein with 4Fe4S-binding SPASM domain